MGRTAPDGTPTPYRLSRWQRRLRGARRFVVAELLVCPSLFVLERVPHRLLRFALRWTLEPLYYLRTRRLSLNHLESALADSTTSEQRRRIARDVARHGVDYLCEILAVLRQGPEFYLDRVDSSDVEEVIDLLRTSKQGFVALTGHIGNWELLAQWLQLNGIQIGGVIAHRHPNARINALIERTRSRLLLDTIYRDDPATRSMRLLRTGKILGVVADQDIKRLSGVFIDFFGRPAYTPIGPARLSLSANVPLICMALIRTPTGFRLIANQPELPRRDAPRDQELTRLTRSWSDQIESIVRAHPEQWAWFHRRWRTTPELLERRGRASL